MTQADATVGEALTASQRAMRRTIIIGACLVAVLVVASYAIVGVGAGPGTTVPGDLVSRLAGTALAVTVGVASVRAASDVTRSMAGRAFRGVIGILLAGAIWYGYLTDGRLRGAMVSVIVAVAVSMGLFVGANRWFDAAVRRWAKFTALTGFVLGALISVVLVGNRLLGWFIGSGAELRNLSWVLAALLAALATAYGWLLGTARNATVRLVTGIAGGGAIGLVVGLFLRHAAWPAPRMQDLLIWPLALAGAGALLGRLRGRRVVPAAVTGAAVGWLTGAWLLGDLGRGNATMAVVASIVLGVLVGARFGLARDTTLEDRLRLEARARVVIFLAPALLFISATLLVPTIRTVLLSLLDRRSAEFVGLNNYVAMFTDPNFLNLARWAGMFTAAPFVWGSALFALAIAIAIRTRRSVEGSVPSQLVAALVAAVAAFAASLAGRLGMVADPTGAGFGAFTGLLLIAAAVLLSLYVAGNRGHSGLAGGAGTSLGAGVFLLAFALFAHLRGTLFNNLWWVFAVTIIATGVGLAVAALADRSRGENVAKSIIFMPMAISFVGAAIIWRFMYIARPTGADQTGVLNAMWVWLGSISTSSTRYPIAVVLVLLTLATVYVAMQGFRTETPGLAWSGLISAVVFAWLAYRFLGPGIGGFEVLPNGDIVPATIQFLTVGPYNNFWIMVPFIWIYTGFAMVIFSAAIKGVPADLLEAGRVDGASESQMFWRVVVPQIVPTIGVVVTTIMVTVMKVFDIVKVMTNGNFGTQVLANEMWTRAFTQRHFGQGSAIAVVLFLSVLPIMYLNIRRMQKEAA